MNVKDLTAPCGIDCFNCQLYEANLNEERIKVYSQSLHLPEEKVACKGCRPSGGCRLHWNDCSTLDCVKEKNVEFCFECGEFPCKRLIPCAEGAAKYPHNMKIYNLCKIKQVGLEKWAEETVEVRKRYFEGKFAVGKGPQI